MLSLQRKSLTAGILCVLICISAQAQKKATQHGNPATSVAATLQQALRIGMDKRPGTAVVVEVESGKIIARQGIETAARRLAAPGSTVKPFVLMALLKSQKLTSDEAFLCHRTLRIAGKRLDCTHPDLGAPLRAEEALAYSCNSYFATMALRLSSSDLVSEFRRAGFDSPTGWSANEVTGVVSETNTPEQRQLQALGEEGVQVTPLELLAAYRALAVQRLGGDKSWDVIYRGLDDSITYGMAHSAAPDGYKVAGKTGTANSTASALTHGWFAGYAPAEKPEIAVVVYLEHGRGSDAARVASAIFSAYGKVKDTH